MKRRWLRWRGTQPDVGLRGERLAAGALKGRGYRIVGRNYTCPAGEIDLIAADGDTLVFVEVKTRVSANAADPEANVTRHKRRQLTRVAKYFLQARSLQDRPCRFDVISVVLNEQGAPAVEHFVNAFEPVFA